MDCMSNNAIGKKISLTMKRLNAPLKIHKVKQWSHHTGTKGPHQVWFHSCPKMFNHSDVKVAHRTGRQIECIGAHVRSRSTRPKPSNQARAGHSGPTHCIVLFSRSFSDVFPKQRRRGRKKKEHGLKLQFDGPGARLPQALAFTRLVGLIRIFAHLSMDPAFT